MSRESLLKIGKMFCEMNNYSEEKTKDFLDRLNMDYDQKEAGTLSQKPKEEEQKKPEKTKRKA